MRYFKILFLCFICLSSLTSCSRHDKMNTTWLPIDYISWGMEKKDIISLLEKKNINLLEENGTVPNRYVLSKLQTCWGFKGTLKLDLKSFPNDDNAYLTSLEFYPEKSEEEIIIKKLNKVFGVERTKSFDNATKGLQWESQMTLSDISDEKLKKKTESLLARIWNNAPLNETSAEMSRPIVIARFISSESNITTSSIYLNGERAAMPVLAERY